MTLLPETTKLLCLLLMTPLFMSASVSTINQNIITAQEIDIIEYTNPNTYRWEYDVTVTGDAMPLVFDLYIPIP